MNCTFVRLPPLSVLAAQGAFDVFEKPKPHPCRPKRIQRKRTKGWRMPEGAIYVGRPTVWGNPFTVADFGAEEAVALYRQWLSDELPEAFDEHPGCWDDFGESAHLGVLRRLPELRGKDLACWCPLPKPGEPDVCHASILLELANR